MRADGADLVDVGGESTRPGAQRVDADEESRRVLPVIARTGGGGRPGLGRHLPRVGRRGGARRRRERGQRRVRRARRPGHGAGRARRRLPMDPDALAWAQRRDAAARALRRRRARRARRTVRARGCGGRRPASMRARWCSIPGSASPRPRAHNWALLARAVDAASSSACRCWSARRASRSSARCSPTPTASRVRSTSARTRRPR